ncbi:MAG: GT4 family glycosyltransferase PelF [Candidatus Hadarchaeum sp.]|uniref:GT4 family glycosyltransferase PelF n=1 Tax=Candidatus Hadarchaeum sp. TaxID=2883567 RepID=UPI0031753C2D
MKVCMITTSFPRWEGDGQGSFIFELSRALVREGVQVQVIAMHSPGAAVYEYIDGIKIFRPRYLWPERLEMLRKEGGGLPATWKKHPWVLWEIGPLIMAQTAALLRLIQDSCLIHAHWSLSAGIGWLGKCFHRGSPPVIVTVHGSDIFQVTKYLLGTMLTRLILRRCNRVIAVSQALANEVINLGINPNKVVVISNGVDVERFKPLPPQHRQNIILYVGSLIERKGVRFLLAAMPNVFAALPDYQLLIVGEGPQYPMLKQMTESLNIADKVVFLGFQSYDQVRTLMQRAKLLVLPSIEEAQGVVLLEALACGTPVVASKVGGIPEVVTRDVGVLVPSANPAALSEAIISILTNSKIWLDMSHQARVRAENVYNWKEIAKQTISVYKEVLGL